MNEKVKKIRIAIGVPTKGSTDNRAYDNHLELLGHLGKLEVASKLQVQEVLGEKFTYPKGIAFEFRLITIARVFPALARERIAEIAIDDGCEYLLFFDDDMLLPPDTFERLFANKKDICAALAFTRLPPYNPVIYSLRTGWDASEKKDYYVNSVVKAYPKNQLVECDAVGFGTVLLNLDVCKNLKQHWFMSTTGSGEDIFFCHKAREAGYKVFVDTSVQVAHLGEPKVVTEETYETEGGGSEHRKTISDDLVKHED